jgi:hypothetical protein
MDDRLLAAVTIRYLNTDTVLLVVSVTVHDVGVAVSQSYHVDQVVAGTDVLSVTCVPGVKSAAHGGLDVGVKLQLMPAGVLVTRYDSDTSAGRTVSKVPEVNVALAVPGAFAVHRHVRLAPGGHTPPHAVSTESAVPVADNCTCVPDTKSAVHVAVQLLMPTGTLLTLPVPLTWIVSGTPGTNVAVSAVVPMPDQASQLVMGT